MASELTAARREVMMASYKVDVIQRQVGDLQKQVAGAQDQMHRIEALLQSLVNPQARILDQTVGRGAPNLRPSKEPRNLPDLVQQTEVEIEMTGRIDELRRITLNSTQGKQWMGAPEGNFNPPSTGYSAVPSGWGQNQLLPACLVSHNLNNLNPSHGPELARQCPQYPRELRNQSQFQYQARQWDPNLSKERVLSVSTVDADLPSFINMTIEQMEQTTVKATSYTVDGHNVDWKSHQILDRTKDEAHFHMKQGAFLYNLEVKTLPKSHHCFFIRLTLEYFKFSSLDSYEFSACKFNNPKHRHYVILSKNIIAASVVTIIEEYFSSGNGNEARNAELGSNGAEKCDIEPSGSADAAASIVAEEEHNFEPVCSEQEKVQAMDVEKSNGEDMPLKKSTFSYTDEVKERFNRILKYYVGTHNFHNFTTRTKAEDPAAKRFIISFTADRVVSLDGIDFVRCEVVWQSFMLHQIRKMIGLAVAVMRNGAPEPIYDVAFRRDVNLNVPTALEVGLYLDEPSGANGDVQEDEHDKLRSLKELGFPEYNPIFINKLITIAMDRKNREKEMASVLLSSLSMELFSTEAIVKGFIMLLESTEDTALDILDASDELGLFLAVAKRSVESAQLKKIRLIMMPLRQVPSRSRNIALSSSCLSTWHYLLYKLGDLINHLSILEAVFCAGTQNNFLHWT